MEQNTCGGSCGCVYKGGRSEAPGVLHKKHRIENCNAVSQSDCGMLTDVVEEVFEDEAESDLWEHGAPVGEGDLVRSHSDRFCHWVEEPDLYIGNDVFIRTCADECVQRRTVRKDVQPAVRS